MIFFRSLCNNDFILFEQDAWLDSVDVEPRFAEKNSKKPIKEEGYQDLSSEDVGKIKRNIANTLNPGETVFPPTWANILCFIYINNV